MISFIKSINPDVTIFTSACVTLSIRVELYTVNRSKMSFESGKFLVFINHVEETGIKFANFGRCSCDIHGLLTSTEDNMLIYWRNTSTVHWSICLVSFKHSRLSVSNSLAVVSFDAEMNIERSGESCMSEIDFP